MPIFSTRGEPSVSTNSRKRTSTCFLSSSSTTEPAAHEPSKPLPFHATSTSSPTRQRGLTGARSNASSHEMGAELVTLPESFCGGGTPPSRWMIATFTLGGGLIRPAGCLPLAPLAPPARSVGSLVLCACVARSESCVTCGATTLPTHTLTATSSPRNLASCTTPNAPSPSLRPTVRSSHATVQDTSSGSKLALAASREKDSSSESSPTSSSESPIRSSPPAAVLELVRRRGAFGVTSFRIWIAP
mmetsp:Transcript_68773/g.206260  ORF Transcript_68773/g.206260 Transcript_68773/m.206260 type:complete len:245 (+) Transcript_68773:971-1705(+)